MSTKKKSIRSKRRDQQFIAKQEERLKQAAANLQASKYADYLKTIAKQRDFARIVALLSIFANILLILKVAGVL